MDDFVLLGPDRVAAWEFHGAIEEFWRDRLRLTLNARRTVVAPLDRPHDVLGYVHRAGGALRVRRPIAAQRNLRGRKFSLDRFLQRRGIDATASCGIVAVASVSAACGAVVCGEIETRSR